MRRLVLAVAALALGSTLASAQAVQVDSSIAAYQKTSGVSGNINSVGSDTMNNMMALWAETFRKMYPNVKIQIEGKGSGTAPPALIAGTSQFGPMSRPMKAAEIDQFEAKYGYKPTQIRTSYDALAIYVNKDNPLEKLTLAQVDAIFSKTRRRGGKDVKTWGDLGLTGDWAGRPISIYGRNSASGTYGFFKEHVLQTGDYKRHGQGAAGLGVGRAGRDRGPLRHRLQRHRLQDLGRQGRCSSPRRTSSSTAPTRTSRAASTRSRASSTSTSTRRRASPSTRSSRST